MMFGLEFSDKRKHHSFPSYNKELAVSPKSINLISPLVWQEHCVECAMPACYKTCVHYKKRSDGRCRLFKYGIERISNNDAILGQNVIIDMDEWAKLETIFFSSGFPYNKVESINKKVVFLGKTAEILKNGKLRRFCYYIKEYYTRKIGKQNELIPDFFLCEIINEDIPYILILENKIEDEIVYRTSLNVKKGFSRFLIPTRDFNFHDNTRNYLQIYPDGNRPQLINFVSLELVSFKPGESKKYLTKSEQKIKCVIWDLDNTIWQGILGDDGLDGIQINDEIVEIIKSLDAKGIINSISSKNYEDMAVKALKHYCIYDYFVSPMINWDPKSKNIESIAKILNIGMDTFLFVDDSAFERNEVGKNCSGIRICDVTEVSEYVKGKAFDVCVTEDGRRRRESYKEIVARNKEQENHKDDVLAFLKDCNMIAEIAKPDESEIARCFELIERTNQLNISAEKLSINEVSELINSVNHECYRIKVKDRFGDYGLVGFAVFNVDDPTCVVLEHFVFSCRAARKKIEQSFFEFMANKFRQKGYKKLELVCKKTEKNRLMRQVLEESGMFEKMKEYKNSYLLGCNLNKEVQTLNIIQIIEK